MMAEAWGKITGEPGICFVTRGPGATNASAGIHIAMQDASPMILFIGQVARGNKEREAWQEVDYKHFFGDLAKWVVEIDDAARIPELVTRAFAVATSGRPGPVVVALPEDMLTSLADAPDALAYTPVETSPGEAELQKLAELLGAAKRPFMVLGGSRWSAEAKSRIEKAAETWALPVGVTFRRQMLFDHLHPKYAGDIGLGPNPALSTAIKQADVLLLIGDRFGEVPSGNYTLMQSPYPEQKLVHVHPDSGELGKVYRPALAINASPEAFANSFAGLRPAAPPSWRGESERLHKSYLDWSTPPETGPGPVQMGPIWSYLESVLPEDVIISNGAGNYATWIHRFHRFRRFATQAAPTSGSMGYGTPAAVAAKALFPEREVIAFAGDGCFLMNGQEFATAVQYDLPIIVIVVNNGTYLKNPDFAALARAYGGHGETVETTAEFAPAFERARASRKPAIIEIKLDPEAITPTRTLTDIREKR